MKRDIPLEKRIIFALDVPDIEEAKVWVSRLRPWVKLYKVGLELFLAAGRGIVDWILDQGCEVMLDLKLFDIPNTVRGAVERIREMGVTYTTVHGNDAILEAAVQAKGGGLKVLAVTVLTSLDQGDLRDLGFQCDVESLVLSRAKRAMELGCDGVVASGRELKALRENLGKGLIIVVPGVRPVSNREEDDQKRVITPEEAVLLGADHIVVGRPIRSAPDPVGVVKGMLEGIERALAR